MKPQMMKEKEGGVYIGQQSGQEMFQNQPLNAQEQGCILKYTE
jgi:hypothetical protein